MNPMLGVTVPVKVRAGHGSLLLFRLLQRFWKGAKA